MAPNSSSGKIQVSVRTRGPKLIRKEIINAAFKAKIFTVAAKPKALHTLCEVGARA